MPIFVAQNTNVVEASMAIMMVCGVSASAWTMAVPMVAATAS